MRLFFTEPEARLLCSALEFWCAELNEGVPPSAHAHAGRYVFAMATALRKRIEAQLPTKEPAK